MDVWRQAHAGSLHEPTAKRVRVAHGGQLIVDTARPLLVWEPRRIVPSYAVPVDDLGAVNPARPVSIRSFATVVPTASTRATS